MPIGIQLMQHTDTNTYTDIEAPFGSITDPVWITVAPKGSLHSTWHRSLPRVVMIPSGINR